jgi:hypothetical protein
MTIQQNVVDSKLYNAKFLDNSNFSLNISPEEEKFIQSYVVIPKILIIH